MFPHDPADWSGIDLRPFDAAANKKRTEEFVHGGYRYATIGELLLAELLTTQEIPFTPEVAFVIAIPEAERYGKDKAQKTYVPDFVFDHQEYLWVQKGHRAELIHGLEAKTAARGRFAKRAVKYSRLLREQRGINIKLISEAEIRRYHAAGGLPLRKRPRRH